MFSHDIQKKIQTHYVNELNCLDLFKQFTKASTHLLSNYTLFTVAEPKSFKSGPQGLHMMIC